MEFSDLMMHFSNLCWHCKSSSFRLISQRRYVVGRLKGIPTASHPPAASAPCPTFDGDDMLPDLVLQLRLVHLLQQLVDGVDVRVDGLEPLDLGSDGGRVGQMLLVVHGSNSKMGPPPPSWCLSDGEGGGTQKWNLWPPAGGQKQRKSLRSGFLPRIPWKLNSLTLWTVKHSKCPGGESPGAEISWSSFSSPVVFWWRPTCCYCAVRAALPRGVPFPNSGVRQARRRFPISSQVFSD